jgi:superfamily II DNA/RNA helicase
VFQQFDLNPKIQKAIEAQGFSEPTDVQLQAIPPSLENKDLMVCARTGSGKSAAFILPMLQGLMDRKAPNSGTRAVILVPTRELAKQILKQCEVLAKFTGIQAAMITGGQEFKFQAAIFRKNPEIIVATPGRLIEHIDKQKDLMMDVEVLVLDEADRMLDMGFEEDVSKIAEKCSEKNKPQTLMFSATLQQRNLSGMAKALLNDPESIVVDHVRGEHSNIQQHYMLADDDKHKERLLTWLLSQQEYRQAIIFCNTKARVETLFHFLEYHNIQAGCLHGDLTQDERHFVMNKMKQGHFDVLVATDVAARGLDVKAIDLVINLEMARSGDDYVHRIGRTGRAGATGTAISLIDHTEWNLKASIERYLQVNMDQIVNKALAGKYKGPKKVKSNGKAASGKKKKPASSKKGNVYAKKSDSKKAKKKSPSGSSGLRKPKVIGDGSAPFKPKKKSNPDDE